MLAARRDRSGDEAAITIVGDDQAGALAEALRRNGPSVRHRSLAETQGQLVDGPVLAVGLAAADGGATLRRRLGPDATLFVVLPSDDVGARLEAFRLGAVVIEATVAADTARAVVEHLDGEGDRTLGWVRSEDLMDAIASRLAVRLGTGRGERAEVKLEDGRALAAALDAFGDALAELSSGVRVKGAKPSSRPPTHGAVMSDLDWEEDPQTMKADLAEVAAYRRMTQAESPRDASGIVPTSAPIELAEPPSERGEPPPRASLIRELAPARPPAHEPLITVASTMSSIELPALPGERVTADAPLPPVLDPAEPGERRVPKLSAPMEQRFRRPPAEPSEARFPIQLGDGDDETSSGRFWLLLLSLAGLGAMAAWWLLG